MKISVRFFTSLRDITSRKEERLEFPDNESVTIDKVLDRLAQRYGKDFIEYVYDKQTSKVRDFLQFLVNGRSILAFGGFKTELSDGDVLAIIPPVGGGSQPRPYV